jgi:hypothetical protein
VECSRHPDGHGDGEHEVEGVGDDGFVHGGVWFGVGLNQF